MEFGVGFVVGAAFGVGVYKKVWPKVKEMVKDKF